MTKKLTIKNKDLVEFRNKIKELTTEGQEVQSQFEKQQKAYEEAAEPVNNILKDSEELKKQLALLEEKAKNKKADLDSELSPMEQEMQNLSNRMQTLSRRISLYQAKLVDKINDEFFEKIEDTELLGEIEAIDDETIEIEVIDQLAVELDEEAAKERIAAQKAELRKNWQGNKEYLEKVDS